MLIFKNYLLFWLLVPTPSRYQKKPSAIAPRNNNPLAGTANPRVYKNSASVRHRRVNTCCFIFFMWLVPTAPATNGDRERNCKVY